MLKYILIYVFHLVFSCNKSLKNKVNIPGSLIDPIIVWDLPDDFGPLKIKSWLIPFIMLSIEEYIKSL